MKNILTFFIIIFVTLGCATSKRVQYVPVQGETRIEYRDSLVYIHDTIKVEIPKEIVKEVIPEVDTSRLETSIAYSEAYLDAKNKKLHHTLKNKETPLKVKFDTIIKVEYVDRYINTPVIQEVPVEVPYIPTFAWICIVFTFVVAAWTLAKIVLKFKSGGLF